MEKIRHLDDGCVDPNPTRSRSFIQEQDEPAVPRHRIVPGDVLHGYCGGYFGRDSYDDKRVEAVGADWIVARDSRGYVHFAHDPAVHQRLGEYCGADDAAHR